MEDLLTRVAAGVGGLRSGLVPTATRDTGIGAIVSPSLIDPRELERRMAAARASQAAAVDEVRPSDTTTLAGRAERLHRLWATVSPTPLEPRPGVRGRAAFETKRTIRRATSWYVEQRWGGQHEIDAETARFASDVAAEIAALHAHVAHLEERNERLEREISALRRDGQFGR